MADLRMTRGDASILLTENHITADAPATEKGFSDLVLLAAIAHDHWKRYGRELTPRPENQ